MREEYDIQSLNPRKNPYSELLTEREEFLEKEFDFSKAIIKPKDIWRNRGILM